MYFVFFKQKTAYEMRISDWSSDVCSSDLYGCSRRDTEPQLQGAGRISAATIGSQRQRAIHRDALPNQREIPAIFTVNPDGSEAKIGRASCRERVCQYV